MKSGIKFKDRVYSIVAAIPEGYVMTYGQIAAMAGNARAARIVGGIAHYGDSGIPWHRVVSKNGNLASGYPGGREEHKKHLESEGVKVLGRDGGYYVEVKRLLWIPDVI